MTKNETGVKNTGINGDSYDNQENFDHDAFWKDLIKRFSYLLLKRAVPEFYEKADITKEPRFLEKEFTDILNTGKPGVHTSPHFADLVLEIPLKNGENTWILFHCESQQGSGGGNLAERMNHYRCLLYAHYRREPVALAIITGSRRRRERFYSHSHFGTEIIYRYNNLVLADLDDEELQASENPIDLALYAGKCALKAKKEIQKYKFLCALTDVLVEHGWSREDKRDLLLFLERVIDLRDKELEKQYAEYRNQLSKEGKIVYIPLGERELAEEIKQRGMTEGIAKGKEEVARNLLANGISADIIAKSTGLPIEQIRNLMN